MNTPDTIDVEARVAEVTEQGWTILEGVLDDDLVDGLVGALDHLEHDRGVVPADNSFEGRHTTRIYNLLAHGEIFERVPVHPAILPVVEGVLDPGCLLSTLSSIAIGPGETAQPIHADDQLIPIPKPHPPIVCNSMLALTDFTEANGATRLVPGSHLADHSPEYGSEHASVAAEMPRGSVLLWHGSLWHGGGENRTDERRIGIANNYCAGFIRQQENQQLGLPPSLVQRFEPRLQQLVGYSIYHGLIGHIDKADPRTLLGSGDGGPMVWDLTWDSVALDLVTLTADWPTETVAASVLRSGRGVVASCGDADLPFALASVTKLLTAWAVHVAAEEETVDLDESATDAGATVADLLAHVSGLGPDGEALAAPRTRRIYSNAGYDRLGELVAERAAMSFADYLRAAVCEPLGMADTALAGSPAHAATSTRRDLERFAAEMLEPRLLAMPTVERLRRPHLPELDGVLPGFGRQSPNPWGLGPEIRGDKHPHWTGSTNAPATHGHFGQTGSFVWVDLPAGSAAIVLTDRPFDSWAIDAWPRFSDAVLGATA